MIAIVGGGISGLTLAYQLQKKKQAYVLLESNATLGGCVQTDSLGDTIAEKGPNSILANDFILDFLKELNLSDQIVVANSNIKKRYVFKSGKYRALPSNPLSLLTSSFFSFSQRIRILKEFKNKSPLIKDTSLYDLINERFGTEAADYVSDPFVSGIYAGDSKELIAELCFPVLTDNIKKHGSILMGFMKNPPKRKVAITLKKGLHQLIEKLAAYVPNIRCDANVETINKNGSKWELTVRVNGNIETVECDKVVLAIPTYRASEIIKTNYPEFAHKLSMIEYPMVRYAHILFDKTQMAFDATGFGGLHPSIEPLLTAGVVWNSSVFEGRTSNDQVLLTCMMNEKRTPGLRIMSEQEIRTTLIAEITKIYKITGSPISISIGVWEHAIPQYNIHMKYVKEGISSLESDHIYFLSNWPNGIGLTDCISNATHLSGSI
jgi:protoporphyrinogen/coproporphyrinogen III oxidase